MTLRQRTVCIALIVVTFAIMVGTVIASGFSTQYEVSVGEVCPEDIYATRNIVDTVTTQERKNVAAAGVEDVYTTDFELIDTSILAMNTVLSKLITAREYPFEDPTAPDIDIKDLADETFLSEDVYEDALYLSEPDFDLLVENASSALKRVMTEGVVDKEEGIARFEELFKSVVSSRDEVTDIAVALCRGSISINKTINVEETEKQREEAKAAIANVTYRKNQVIARRGEIITEAQLAMLKELGFVKGATQIDFAHTVSVILLLLLVTGLVIVYYYTAGKKEITASPVTVTIISSTLTIIGALIILFGIKSSGNVIYVMPLSLIPALISLLLGGNMACIVNIVTAVLAGIQTNDLSITISLILAGTATAYIFSRVRRRAHLLSATVISAVIYALSYSAILIDTSKNMLDVFIVFAYALLGGFFGGILTIGTVPFWEAIFDVITPMKLGELSNPEHHLLKKMLLKAPGSYHHALTVANMADAAADAIGANALLARVGAYYHDIGKLENPLFFKENQFGGANPHDELPPEESAEIILKHVSDGAALAAQYRLPTAVRDIIIQHHGTTTVSYFLFKARQSNPDVDPSLFTYPGPRPASREATIIMLADACEAAVRAMREKGDVDVRRVVEDIVTARISDNQLSASSLTFSDLETVKDSFVTTLEQYFHKRILYPQNEKKD